MRNISEKTILTVLVNLKCIGTMGKCVKGFTKKERAYIFDELEKRGFIEVGGINTTRLGDEVIKRNLNLLKS